MSKNAHDVTKQHIDRVAELIESFCSVMRDRGQNHDASKFTEAEMKLLEQMQQLVNTHGNVPYGSQEYNDRLKILEPMLKHHYANNSHHPEHYSNGIAGMDLFDLVEMFCDWKAASERGEEWVMNISASVKRYNIDPQLESILINTARNMGFAYK